jgi:glycosyltransferase involved in cell wall biosynthesis
MKILLLTDIPPCKNFTAGLVLDQLCRFLPHDSIACVSVTYSGLNVRISPDLQWIPIQYIRRPHEVWPPILPIPHRLKEAIHLRLYRYNDVAIRRITAKAVEYGRAFRADTLWCTLEGQSLIRLAIPVAQGLGVPLLTEVFDPPTWELRDNSAHRLLKERLLNEFANAIRYSRMCATASWLMAEQYAHDYGANTVAFLPSLEHRFAMPPAKEMNSGKELIIGLAGQVYATNEWKALVTALNAADWKVGNRTVRIRLLGKYRKSLIADRAERIEHLGWHTQENTVKLLSEADILYCPYWLDPGFKTEARLSFPSKLATYLAAGRPVLFHGPEYASPAQFLKENEAGFACHSNEASHLIEALTTLATDMSLYSRLTYNGRIAFDKYLTLYSLRKSFARFLGVEEDFLVSST